MPTIDVNATLWPVSSSVSRTAASKIVSLGSKEGKLESQLKKVGVKYSMIRSGKKLGHLVKGSYPTYLFYHKGNIQIWNNNSFGTKALDFIESELN